MGMFSILGFLDYMLYIVYLIYFECFFKLMNYGTKYTLFIFSGKYLKTFVAMNATRL